MRLYYAVPALVVHWLVALVLLAMLICFSAGCWVGQANPPGMCASVGNQYVGVLRVEQHAVNAHYDLQPGSHFNAAWATHEGLVIACTAPKARQ